MIRRRKNKILSLKCGNSSWVWDEEWLRSLAINFFVELYNEERTARPQFPINGYFLSLSLVQQGFLLDHITNEEIKLAICNMKEFKALKPDGFQACFY